jgi:hypothetical protein
MANFRKRSGSTIREYNINMVIEMLKSGMSEGDVLTELAMSFCTDTRTDYLNTAKEKLKIEKLFGEHIKQKSDLPLPDGLKPNPNGEPDSELLKEYAKKHPNSQVFKKEGEK